MIATYWHSNQSLSTITQASQKLSTLVHKYTKGYEKTTKG